MSIFWDYCNQIYRIQSYSKQGFLQQLSHMSEYEFEIFVK